MKKHLFAVQEISKDGIENYALMMTDSEMTSYLKTKREVYGYIPGIGGDKKYSIVACYMTSYCTVA